MSPWVLGSGNRTDYEIHVTDAYFAPDAAYQNGETTLLHLIGVDENGTEQKEMFNVGKDWISTDGGKTVQSTKGSKTISRNSMYGKFIEAALETGEQTGAQLEGRGDANEAKVWIGTAWHMMEREISFGRNLDPTWRNMPDVFLGIATEGQVAAPVVIVQTASAASPTVKLTGAQRAAAALAKVKPATTATAATNGNGNGNGDGLMDQIITLAKSSPDFEAFVNAVVDVPGVTDDDELSEVVFDPEASGLYAIHHG